MARNRVIDTIVPDNYLFLGSFDVLFCSLVRVAFRVENKTADSYRMLLNCSFRINRDIFASVFNKIIHRASS